MTQKKERKTASLSNYTNNNYFTHQNNNKKYNHEYPDFTVRTSIDFLTLSIKENADHHTLRDILTSIGFKSIRHDTLAKGNYRMMWTFKHADTGITAEVFYASKKICYPSLMLTIHDPDKELVNLLHQNFLKHKIHVNLSFVELTFDFFTEDRIRLREFLKSITFMNNARSKPGRKKTTYYLNNPRKSVRGMRIYTRPESKHVRMEVTLKSQLLKRLGLSFPLDSIDSLDLTRFFSFKCVDQERLRKYLIWSNRKLIEKIDQKRPGFGSLVECQIQSWINCIVMDAHGSQTYLMDQITEFKFGNAIPTFTRFLLPIDDFSEDFMKKVSGQKFLS